MTTRNSDVVTKVEEVYRLKPLSDGNSKKLFYKRIQTQEGESLDAVSGEMSSKIIDKCGGIPLAIIAMASLLVERRGEDWSKVYESIGFGNEDNTKKILSYSYYDLPSYLKPCLLHLSIFPEDYIVDTKSVIWMWIGEGFVHLDETEVGSLFDVGERYFNELVNRSMIQPIDDDYGQLKQRFHIHDIVLDLIRELSKDENFVTISGSREQHASMDGSGSEKKTSIPCLDRKVRRLALLNHHVRLIPEDIKDMTKVLRSLNSFWSKTEIMAPLHSFRFCCVLNIEHCYVPISLKHVGKLLHLKYLEVSSTPVDEIPKEIEHLKSLQTLILIETGLHELPPAVCSLAQLMCPIAEGFEKFPADRMGNLTSLEELQLKSIVGRSATQDFVVELGKLTIVRVVTITFSEELEESMQKALLQSLSNLRELQELVLYCKLSNQPGATIWEDWEMNHFCLPCLYFLSLGMYTVDVHDLDSLARCPELRYLDLGGYSWPPVYTVGTNGFRNLRFCNVKTALKFHMGAMPSLEELEFRVFAGYDSWQVNGVPLEQFPTKSVIEDLDLSLNNLLSLEQVTVKVECSGATAAEVLEVEAVVTSAVENHPNRPTLKMERKYEERILSDEDQEALVKDEPDAYVISHMRRYRRLQEAVISIDCAGASTSTYEVEKVEAAFRHAAEAHRNHPTVQLVRTNTDEMVLSSDHPDTELDDDDDSPDNTLSRLQLRN